MLPLETSPWLDLYTRAADWISSYRPVVDLGSGTGRFAELLRRRGHAQYVGIDFSAAAIAEAERYVPLTDKDTAWDAEFIVADLRDWMPDPDRSGATIYVCLETLEHLDDDNDLIRRVPPGHELILSVPNYPSEAHLRVFHNAGDAIQRYGNLLAFSDWTLVGGNPRYHIHLYRARRRGDSW